MKTFAFGDEVTALALILPGVEEWGSFETLSDVFEYRQQIREEIDLLPNMFKMHVSAHSGIIPTATHTYVSALQRDRVVTLEYTARILTEWLVTLGFEKAGEITPASNTGVEVNPHA